MQEFRESFPRSIALIEAGIAARQQIGAQVFVSREGFLVADAGIGESQPGVPMAPDSLMIWFSSTKPIAAIALGQLWDRGQIDWDAPVARYVPEFAQNGKAAITLRHILTHTAKFRGGGFDWPDSPWEAIVARVCSREIEPDWGPGERAGYCPMSSWFMLAEVVNRVDGRFYSQYVREEIFEPLGMNDSWIGMPRDRYQAYGDRIGQMQSTEKGELHPDGWTTETHYAACNPGGNGVGPIHELGRIYEMLLGGGSREGVRVLTSEAVRLLTTRQRVGMFDETFKHKMDWGLGLIVNSNCYGPQTVPYGYGLHSSPETFGHSGWQSSTGFADPEHGLAVALVLNGTPGEARHNRRFRLLLTAIYEDLGIKSISEAVAT